MFRIINVSLVFALGKKLRISMLGNVQKQRILNVLVLLQELTISSLLAHLSLNHPGRRENYQKKNNLEKGKDHLLILQLLSLTIQL